MLLQFVNFEKSKAGSVPVRYGFVHAWQSLGTRFAELLVHALVLVA
jgi:hypothetical protein